jgi:hypothetical protein
VWEFPGAGRLGSRSKAGLIHQPDLTQYWSGRPTAQAFGWLQLGVCAVHAVCLGVQAPCPGIRGAEGHGKRKGVLVRERLKAAWNERAGEGHEPGMRCGPVGTSGHTTEKSSIPKRACFINLASMHGGVSPSVCRRWLHHHGVFHEQT